ALLELVMRVGQRHRADLLHHCGRVVRDGEAVCDIKTVCCSNRDALDDLPAYRLDSEDPLSERPPRSAVLRGLSRKAEGNHAVRQVDRGTPPLPLGTDSCAATE